MRSAKDDQDQEARSSRRSLLRTAALAAVAAPAAGCDLLDNQPPPPPAPDPLAPLIAEALDLAARHEAAAAAFPQLAARLSPLAQAHRAHAAELGRVTGTPAPSGTAVALNPSPTGLGTSPDPQEVLDRLRTAEQRARASAQATCLTIADRRAALVGSIAAARATHLEVLR